MKRLRKRINTDSVMPAAWDAGSIFVLKEGMEISLPTSLSIITIGRSS